MYTLLGSLTSPFVRRIRFAMEHIPHELKILNIYDEAGAQELNQYNPINQIPCLIDKDQPIWDSRIILQYLNQKHSLEKLSLEQENRLTAIERMLDAGIALFLMKKSDIDINHHYMYVERQKARITSVMTWLTPWLKTPEAKEWNFTTMSLYAALDWMKFRDVHPLALSETASNFVNHHQARSIVELTDPRKVTA